MQLSVAASSMSPRRPTATTTSNNPYDGLIDGDGNAVAHSNDPDGEFQLVSPKKLSKKERQAKNKTAKGIPVDVSQQVKGQIATLKKHNWEKKQALDAKKEEQAAAEKIEIENSRWQLNPRFGELSAQVNLFDGQINGEQIGHIYIGESGMGYFGYHIGDNKEEHQMMLDTVDTHETYKGKYILTDSTKSGSLNEFFLDTEVTISVIVEESTNPDEVHSGNAWVLLSEEQLMEKYSKSFNLTDNTDEE